MNSGFACSHSPVSHWSISRWAIGEPITVNVALLNLQLASDGAKCRGTTMRLAHEHWGAPGLGFPNVVWAVEVSPPAGPSSRCLAQLNGLCRMSPPWTGMTASEHGLAGLQPRNWFCRSDSTAMSATPVPLAVVVDQTSL